MAALSMEKKIHMRTPISHGISLIGLLLISFLFISITCNGVSADCTGVINSQDADVDEYGDGIDGPYVDNEDGTVSDQGTGLMWQQTNDENRYVWADACQYCEELALGGYTDWTLPDLHQLSSIIDTHYSPTINTNFFKGTKNVGYWSGSTYAVNTDNAWLVSFNNGSGFYPKKTSYYSVRCVRSGSSGSFDPLEISAMGTPLSGNVPFEVSFSTQVSGGNPPYDISWDFGDGTYGEPLEAVTHIYDMPGTYTATVSIADNSGQSSTSKPMIITVTENVMSRELIALPSALTVPIDNTSFFYLSGGSGFYTSTPENYDIAISSQSINEDSETIITVTGKSLGTTLIQIEDSDGRSLSVPINVTEKVKAIIVAGSGPYPGNMLWNHTLATCSKAYRILMAQGYTHETILFLSADHTNIIDIDGDGKFNEVDGYASADSLRNGITEWATDAKDVLIFMTGHGGAGSFLINGDSFISSDGFSEWLSTLKNSLSGQVVFVYDSCYSGSFMPEIKSDGIITITSSSQDEVAFFTSFGQLSFSSFFFDGIFNGGSVKDSFFTARNSTRYTHPSQNPLIDDNGNGIGNEDDDGELARSVYIGNGIATAADILTIANDAVHVSQNEDNTILVSVNNVVNSNPLKRVWAVVTPPNFAIGTSGDPVLDLPIIEFENLDNTTKYQGMYTNANQQGTYNFAIFAEDNNGSISFPVQTHYTLSKIFPSCIDFSDDLGLELPCVELGGDDYHFYLKYDGGLTWSMDPSSFGLNTSTDDLSCLKLSDDLCFEVPCTSFMGTQYGFIFNYNGNPIAGNHSWKIDPTSLKELH